MNNITPFKIDRAHALLSFYQVTQLGTYHPPYYTHFGDEWEPGSLRPVDQDLFFKLLTNLNLSLSEFERITETEVKP